MADLPVPAGDYATLVAIAVPACGVVWYVLRTVVRLDGATSNLDKRLEAQSKEMSGRLDDMERSAAERHEGNRRDVVNMQIKVGMMETMQATLTTELRWIKDALIEIKDNLRPPRDRPTSRDRRDSGGGP